MKGLSRKRVWDLGGTLNELDSPSEVPDGDVIECVNWKVHKDGKSRVKRPGYAEYDVDLPDIEDPIIQIREYEDGNKIKRKIVITTKSVLMQKEVIAYDEIWTGDFIENFPGMSIFDGKLVFTDEEPGDDLVIRGTEDGETFSEIADCNFGASFVPMAKMIEWNDKLWVPCWDSSYGGHLKIYEEGVGCSEYLFSSMAGCYSLVIWDGRLWALAHKAGNTPNYWKVWNNDGSSWNAIIDYDGDSYVDANPPSANRYSYSENMHTAKLVVFNRKLYMICTVYDDDETDDSWQVWQFDKGAYDNFKKVYDSSDDDEFFCFGAAEEYKGYMYVFGCKIAYGGNEGALYRSSNMITWEVVDSTMDKGHPVSTEVFDGRLYVMTNYEADGIDPANIYYWDKYDEAFVLEKSITRGSGQYLGSILEYKGDLYAGAYRSLYKRVSSENTWTEIITFEEEIEEPPSEIIFEDRLMIADSKGNIMIEGEAVHTLGIESPGDACTVASADGAQVTDEVPDTGDGEATVFFLVLDNPYIQKSSITITYTIGAVKHDATDDGKGKVTGTQCEGTAYYDRGLIVVEFDTAPDDAIDIEVDYKWSNLYGEYKYLTTFYRSGNYPCESNPSPESAVVTLEGKKGSLTAIPVSTDPKANSRRIYRTTADGAIFFWLVDIEDNSTTIYTDDIHDDSLGDEVSYDRGVPKKGSLFEVWDNRLWIAGNEAYPMMLFFTNTNTAEEMADLNFLAIRRRDGQPINQIKAFGDRLYVFKKESFFEVSKSGTSMYEVIEMPQAVGADAAYSVAVCDKLMIWKSKYGIEVFNGDSCFRPTVSEKIKNVMASINNAYLYKCAGGHNFKDHEYWLTIPTGEATEPDLVIVFDYLRMSFTTYSFNEDLRSFVTVTEYVTGNLLHLIGTADGNLYIVDDDYYDDNGVAISASFKTGWFNVTGEHEMWNVLRRMFILYQIPADKTITLKIYTNYNETAVATISLAGSSPTPDDVERREIMRRLNLGIRGYHVMFEFINNEKVGGKCKIMGWDMYFRRKVWKYTSEGD